MELKVRALRFEAGKPVCMVHEKTAKKMSLHVGNRVLIKKGDRKIISVADTVQRLLRLNEIAVSQEIIKQLNLKNKSKVEVEITSKPHSIDLIKNKLKGKELSKKEIYEIIRDISNNALTEAEVAFFISAVYSQDMSLKETKALIRAMVKTGSRLRLRGKIADKHCIGGIAGNRTTPIIISICSAAGLIMPKTSSRAITSAAGTADVIETLARVDFSTNKIKRIIKKTNACFVWGGALGLAPVDDKIIKIGRVVKIDSTAQLLASILSKKISVDSKYILIDIPYGKSAKVTKAKAEKLKYKFLAMGREFDLKLKVVLTNGKEPIGNGIGPVLEMNDVLKILKRKDGPKDLEEKSIMLAGNLLEMTGKAKKGKGIELAKKILNSGLAYKKFKQIIKIQKGKIKKLRPGKYNYTIESKKTLKIKHLNNKLINALARQSGSPDDKAAGVYLYKKTNQVVKKKEKIMTIYAVSEEKLQHAKKFYQKNKKEMIEFF